MHKLIDKKTINEKKDQQLSLCAFAMILMKKIDCHSQAFTYLTLIVGSK